MLGSRFDLDAKLDELNSRRAMGEASDDADGEAPCAELERAMAAVAKSVHAGARRVSFRCPVCDDAMRLREERELSEFAGLDIKLHRLECDTCGMLTGRVYHPSVGYHTRLVR